MRENLWAFAEVHGVSRRACGAVAGLVRADELADRRAGQLSGGEQRRLHTAIALVHRPRVVLLDEPTAGADTQTRGGDPRRRAGGRARAGTAVVYTTHYLPEVEELGADVALLEAGRVIASGTIAALVAAHASSVLEVAVRRRARRAAPGRVAGRAGAPTSCAPS